MNHPVDTQMREALDAIQAGERSTNRVAPAVPTTAAHEEQQVDIAAQLWANAQEQSNRQGLLEAQVAALVAQLARITNTETLGSTTPARIVAEAPPPPALLSTKKRLAELSKFSGDRTTYEAWKLEALAKLQWDGSVIGPAAAQMAYLYMRMETKAQKTVAAYYKQMATLQRFDPAEFIAYLDTVYLDPNAAARAMSKLHALKQGDTESFALFFPKFERLLVEAGAGMYPEQARINYLRGALNMTHKRALVGQPSPVLYHDFGRAVHVIGSQLDELRYGDSDRRSNQRERQDGDRHRGNRRAQVDAEGDTIMTSKARPQGKGRDSAKRAEWADEAEMQRRYDKGLCLRCGKDGHLVRDCPLRTPRRPDAAPVKARKSKTKGRMEPESDSGEDQGRTRSEEEDEESEKE